MKILCTNICTENSYKKSGELDVLGFNYYDIWEIRMFCNNFNTLFPQSSCEVDHCNNVRYEVTEK